MDQIKFCFLLKLPGFAVLGCGTGVGGDGDDTRQDSGEGVPAGTRLEDFGVQAKS